jgi:polar amino acid transport system substrate-binding protein
MRKGKSLFAVTVVLLTVLALAAALGACGSTSGSTTTASSSAAASTIEQILGHAPTGVAAQILQNNEIRVADDANYPPQSYMKGNELIGFDVDVAKKVAELLGVQVKFINPNWDAVPGGLKVGRWDVSIGSMTRTTERAKSMDFAEPYYYTQGQLMVKQGAPLLTTVDSLKGKKIGCGVATTYQDFLKAVGGVTIKTYDTDASTFPDLANGRLDGVMTADLTASQAIAGGKPFQLSGQPFYYEPLCFAIRKGETDLLTLLNYTVKKMREDGSLTTMSKTWYHGFDVTSPPASGVPEFEAAVAQLKGQ